MLIPVYIVSGFFLFALFVLFLVIGRTLNSIVNHFMKIEYLVTREREYFEEGLEIRRLMVDKITAGKKRPA